MGWQGRKGVTPLDRNGMFGACAWNVQSPLPPGGSVDHFLLNPGERGIVNQLPLQLVGGFWSIFLQSGSWLISPIISAFRGGSPFCCLACRCSLEGVQAGPLSSVVALSSCTWSLGGTYSELPLIWTPEMRPPLYSGHFKRSQSMLPSANLPLKWGHPSNQDTFDWSQGWPD